MSVTLNFHVCHQNITRADSCILVADSLNYAYAHFDFCSSDWDGLIKTAVFTRGQDTYEQILENDQCLIPWEVLPEGKGIFTVSVFAGNRITTNVVKVKLDASGWSFALESSQPPTEGVYSQILTRLADVEDTVVESAESAAQSATSAAESAQSAEQSMEAARTAKNAAEEAAGSVTQYSKTSESWAVGGTGTRTGEDTDNSKYYAEQAGAASQTAVSAGNIATGAAQAATQAAGSASQSAQTAAEGAQIVQELYDGAVSDITAAKTAAVGAIQTKGDQVLDSIPEDYTELSGDVSQLKADFNDKVDLPISYEDVEITLQDGYYLASGFVSSSSFKSAKVAVTTGERIAVTGSGSTYAYAYYFVNDNGAVISKADTALLMQDYELTVPVGATYIEINDSGSTKKGIAVKKIIVDRDFRVESLVSGVERNSSATSGAVESLYTNTVVTKTEYHEFSYTTKTSAWKTDPIWKDLTLNANTDYVLYCANGETFNDSVLIEVRIYDNNDAIKVRASLRIDDHYAKFNTGEYTKADVVLYIATTSAPDKDGTAFASNVILFEGADLYPVFSNSDTVPTYDLQMLATKEAIINGNDKDCGINGDSFVFITDYHHWTNDGSGSYNAETSPKLIKHILEHTGVDFVVNNGDLVHIADSLTGSEGMYERATNIRDKFDAFNGRVFHNIGNHEWYALEQGGDESTCMISGGEVFGLFLSPIQRMFDGYDGDLSYYIDNRAKKIRYFFLGCNIYCEETNETQFPWFLKELENVPDDYRIVTFVHKMWNSTHTGLNDDFLPVANGLDALKAHSSAFTYNGITYDYSNSTAIPIAIFSGHSHEDGNLTTTGGIPVIVTTTDAYRAESGDIIRTLGTSTEQAFDVVQFDFDNRKIYCTRIGAGTDREFSY